MFGRPAIGRLTSPFGYRTHPITGQRLSYHQGVDIAQQGNVPIYAAAAGTVTRVGRLGTYGNVVMIVHNINGKTYETNYAHLKSYQVKVGQKVKQGQQIAYMGNTGNSTGQHLHFEIHVGRWATGQPNAVDPLKYITLVPALGAIGSDVEEVQHLLNAHGYSVTVDGHFGADSDKALKDFQRSNGLDADGKAGPATMIELKKELDNVQVSSAPAEIEELQRLLNAAGFGVGVTGSLDKSTLNAMLIFQRRVGMNADTDKIKETIEKLKKRKEEPKLPEYKKDAQPSKSLATEFKKAVEAGITDGTYPQRPVTREEAAVMAYRAYMKNK